MCVLAVLSSFFFERLHSLTSRIESTVSLQSVWAFLPTQFETLKDNSTKMH